MITLDKLTNFRIQLHMFVYPQHIDRLLEDISSLITQYTGYCSYEANNKRIIVRVPDNIDSLDIMHQINDIFAKYLSSSEVEKALRPNINEEAFNDYKMITLIRDNYIFLYNATVIGIMNHNNTIIVQL